MSKVEVLRIPGLPAHALERGVCYYCGRGLTDILTDGCGSKEFDRQETVDQYCSVQAFIRRQAGGQMAR